MNPFHDQQITYFARTNHRNTDTVFGIKRPDRLFHTYIIGKTGTGKTTLLETLLLQDIHNGEGLTVIDPHGDMVERVASRIPAHRKDDLLYLNVPDPSQPFGYNPLASVAPDRRSLAASGILEVFHKYWGERAWGQRMEHIFRYALLAILELEDVTLLDVLELLRDDAYRKHILPNIRNEQVAAFWKEQYPDYAKRYLAEAIAPIQNKIAAFIADPLLCRILTSAPEPLNIRKTMDERKVLLVNLAKGKLGDDTAGLLGALLTTTIGLAGFSRADVSPQHRPYHFLYLDEFQSFTTPTVANMLSELRKYNLSMTVAHQYLSQLLPEVRDAVLGNAGTLISFRLGAHDASFVCKEFHSKFDVGDVVNLPNHDILLKLMIDGSPSKPFSATTIEPYDGSSFQLRERQRNTQQA